MNLYEMKGYHCLLKLLCLLPLAVHAQTACTNCKDTDTFTFAFSNDGFPTNFVRNGELIGHSVELVEEVCKFAGKTCYTALVQRKQCWDSTTGFPPFSKVLNSKSFACCASFQESPERSMSYGFPKQSYFRAPFPTLIASKKSKITLNDLKECNDLTLAFPENTVLEPDCLLDAGLFIRERNFIPIRTTEDFLLTSIMDAVTQQVVERKADLGIVLTRFSITDEVRILTELQCSGEVALGINNMMRKDDAAFIDWWDSNLHKFMCSAKYPAFCKRLTESDKYNGVDPLCRVQGEDLDCSKFRGKPAKKKTEDVSRRINPCISEQCRKRNDLVFGTFKDEVYELRDDLDRGPEKALQGSKSQYSGQKKKDVLFVIVASDGSLFRPDKVCVTVKNVLGIKFTFRGGEKESEELRVLVDFRKEWTTHCERSEQFRKNVRMEFQIVKNFQDPKDEKIRIRDMLMEGCTSRAFVTQN